MYATEKDAEALRGVRELVDDLTAERASFSEEFEEAKAELDTQPACNHKLEAVAETCEGELGVLGRLYGLSKVVLQ